MSYDPENPWESADEPVDDPSDMEPYIEPCELPIDFMADPYDSLDKG